MSNKIKLSVPGMMCGGCVSSINKALDAEAQVVSSNVDLPTKTVLIETDASAAFLINTLKTAGYEASEVS